jgi:hypothetical protein
MVGQQLKLSIAGEKFIKSKADTKNLLSGKNNYGLPFSTIRNDDITFTYGDDFLTNTTTSTRFVELLIHWFNKYGLYYKVDPNIIAAQAYQESTFNSWTYSGSKSVATYGGALGITQFLPGTIFEVMINTAGGGDFGKLNEEFTNDEKNLIKNNLTGNPNIDSAYVVNGNDRDIGITNRSILHQNVINNPELMIKAQCVYMNLIGKRNANIAASSLFAYNAAGGNKSKNYNDAVFKVLTNRAAGVDYVKKIITSLNKNFGYNFSEASLEASTAQSASAAKK